MLIVSRYLFFISQIVIILPIIVSINTENLETLKKEYEDLFLMLNANISNKLLTILWCCFNSTLLFVH